jgi:hypothetical protein
MPRRVTHVCNKEAEIAVMKNTLDNTNKLVEEIHHRLIGNGNPGMIADIKDLKAMKEDYHATKIKVETISNRMYYTMGALAILMILLNIFGSRIAQAVLG